MTIRRQTVLVWRWFQIVLFYVLAAVFLSGCAAESPNPLAVENLNGAPPKQEGYSIQLDCSGILNGAFFPGGNIPSSPYAHPVNFSGKWSMKHMDRSQWYMATCAEAGARIDVVATMSRVVFDFWDYEFYANPGKVTFLIDDRKLGTFDLARPGADGLKFLNYQIATQKNTVATVSMILESGRVTVTGFLINTFDKNFPY
ncbi:MAG: hypothetical protein PHD82_10720 [Candidatus Riflebacteria bacterium]|jgi:hypothetical protein|nr:hypothetical protein [Candidatus Riflebacteria bacterium]